MSTFEDLGSLLMVRGADELDHAGAEASTCICTASPSASPPWARPTPWSWPASPMRRTEPMVSRPTCSTGRPSARCSSPSSARRRSCIVYRYGSCERETTWRDLAEHHTVTDRFTGTSEELSTAELRDFVDLTIVNELDVLDHAPALAPKLRPFLQEQIPRWQSLTSPAVLAESQRILPL